MPLDAPGEALGVDRCERPVPHLALQRTEHFGLGQQGRINRLAHRTREEAAYPDRPDLADIALDQGARIHIESGH